MKKETLLKLLHDFHFDALSKEPFLCVFNHDYGIYYSIKHPLYGKLSRVFYSNNILEIKNFLSLYRFYLEHDKDVTISFDNYKVENPLVSFFYKDKKIYSDDLDKIQISTYKNEEDEIYFKKLVRTALLLQEVIVAKIKLQRDCHDSVLKFSKEYYALMKKIEDKMHKYDSKIKKEVVESIVDASFYDYTLDYLEIKKEDVFSLTLDNIKNYIKALVSLLKKIDQSTTFIQDKYELLCYPLRIDLAGQELDYLDGLLKKKIKLFSKKENVDQVLLDMEKNHFLSRVVKFSLYKKNELEHILEKYSMVDDIDIRTLGDFFIEFDNLKVGDVKLPKKKNLEKKSSAEVLSYLEQCYSSRDLEEQSILVLYHSMLKPIWYYMDMKQETLLRDYITDFIRDLKLSCNSMIRFRYFKNISTLSIEDCEKTIALARKAIEHIECDTILDDFVVYFKDGKQITKKKFLEASNRRYLAPSQTLGEQDIIYICTLKRGSQIYYVPKELCYDLEQDDTFLLKNNVPYFLIDTEKNDINGENSDIITVVEYKGKKIHEDGYVLVDDIKSAKVHRIKEIVIERKGSSE